MLAFGLSVIASLVARLPYRWLRALGSPLAWAVGGLARVRRRHVEEALARARVPQPRARAGEMYRSLATGVMELLWLSGRPRTTLRGLVAMDAASELRLQEALAAGRGAVVAASHTGNWEVAACAMAARMPLSVLTKRVSIGGFDRFMRRLRAKYEVGLLEGEGALARARREVLEGRVVALLLDQVPPQESQGVWAPFLGEPALTSRAAAALAASTGAPLLVTASRRSDDGAHVVQILSVSWPPLADHHAWTATATRESAELLSSFIARHPAQWLWLHRRWKRPPAGGLSGARLAAREG